MFTAYTAELDPQVAEKDLNGEWLLYILGLYPSPIYRAIDALSGNTVHAERTVNSGGVQLDGNVSTRREVSRWYGVSILYTLYMADMVTSGTDNDWGFGISPLLDEVWFCD